MLVVAADLFSFSGIMDDEKISFSGDDDLEAISERFLAQKQYKMLNPLMQGN